MARQATASQKEQLKKLGFEPDVNYDRARQMIAKGAKKEATKAPEATPAPEKAKGPWEGDSKPLIERPEGAPKAEAKGTSKIPASGDAEAVRKEARTGVSKIPESGDKSGFFAPEKAADDIVPNKALKAVESVAEDAPKGGLGAKIAGALETLHKYADEIPGARAFIKGLGVAGKVAGPVGAAYGAVSELEGTALNEGEDQEFALLEKRLQEMSPEERTRYLLTGQSSTQAPMSGSEEPGLGGAPQAPSSDAPTSPSERRLETALGGGGLGAPSAPQADPEAPAEAVPLPGHKPVAPPPSTPLPERKPMAPTAPAQGEDPAATKLQQMFGLMKENNVQGFNWGDKAFVRDEQMPSGYRVQEAEQAATELSQAPAQGLGLGGRT